ncbi:tripartite tricarboxylate transporter substrate-binding protein [Frigidibacter sp. ROC022]|uniref:tripartite tricarboxylate transporter substrate-binding protein n=1 Tax=Frigidibacter sp. ROC022 TaxID=2971796 RepID=UPI00215B5894|nr:tripartite tricarboxylate transporter substrate-binding protein [Frigidibacter sp. ROC022]MCR8725546.1 tripartite tricarboxylate transporter substrate-binding protein [Frigidibacter sp. ROC022]
MASRFVVSAFCLMLPALSVSAEDVTIRVGYGPGGSYDSMARVIADHLGDHLPGSPNVVVENLPGAGSLKLAKLVMESTETDGSQIATISSALALAPVFDPDNRAYDPRQAHYLISMTSAASYCITPKASGIDTLDAFLTGEFKVGATGKASTTYVFPAAIKKALDTNYQIVTGFGSATEIDLAMERGDIQARCGIGMSNLFNGDMLERYNVITELSREPKHEIDGVPFLLDRISDPETHEAMKLVLSSSSIHHPFVAPPATSEEALDDLLAGFAALATDEDFLADAKKRGLYLSMTDGPTVEAKIAEYLASDPAVQDLARELVQ